MNKLLWKLCLVLHVFVKFLDEFINEMTSMIRDLYVYLNNFIMVVIKGKINI